MDKDQDEKLNNSSYNIIFTNLPPNTKITEAQNNLLLGTLETTKNKKIIASPNVLDIGIIFHLHLLKKFQLRTAELCKTMVGSTSFKFFTGISIYKMAN